MFDACISDYLFLLASVAVPLVVEAVTAVKVVVDDEIRVFDVRTSRLDLHRPAEIKFKDKLLPSSSPALYKPGRRLLLMLPKDWATRLLLTSMHGTAIHVHDSERSGSYRAKQEERLCIRQLMYLEK
ncbi:unnamed protein product [Lactuca virosa]|uniref:Uncharacterized protein n=1 Tax=Lactuca virosa TaxID=75947 RepID=A0AAU9MGH4_9ASTR|nr:unnamed protein product [Lactuca virosa]